MNMTPQSQTLRRAWHRGVRELKNVLYSTKWWTKLDSAVDTFYYRVASGLEAGGDRDVAVWSRLFKMLVSLVRQLYTRDTRRQFCPSDHWISPRVSLPLDRPQDISFRRYLVHRLLTFKRKVVFLGQRLPNSFGVNIADVLVWCWFV